MDTGGPLDYGLCAAVDVHYLSTGGARAAAVLAANAAFADVLAERTAVVPRVPAYRPGEFYRRELPPLCAVLDDLSGLGLLVVDGYADLDPAGRPGLGAHAHGEFGIPVIGWPGPGSAPQPTRCRSCADLRCAGCSSPRPGCPQPTPRIWSGASPAGTGCPARCAARAPSRGTPARARYARCATGPFSVAGWYRTGSPCAATTAACVERPECNVVPQGLAGLLRASMSWGLPVRVQLAREHG